ncbi:MAG TPA: cobalt ECF transporter T component CbiQ, partial [Nitrospirae bacterium]|nr:cobalt ECF transporter T component CbiQ [Nitrospirota bacterium]HEW81501.1 cobalt ECF transporter T component CbiQ [Nitrospirota bacterium]
MSAFNPEYFNIGHLDTLSYRHTFVHDLNPVIKLIVTLVFILLVVSFPKYEIQGIVPFFMFPLFMIIAGEIPAGVIFKKLLVVSPFVLFIGIFNPMLDKEIIYRVFGVPVSGGWISYGSLIIRFILTVSSALLLIATTSFPGICLALEKLRVPKIFIVQLLFLYRYTFVLAEEVMKIIKARNMRSFGKKGKDIKSFISITGVLLVRSIERSERIYQAICSRGFDGQIRLLKDFRLRGTDILFALVTISIFIIFRKYAI